MILRRQILTTFLTDLSGRSTPSSWSDSRARATIWWVQTRSGCGYWVELSTKAIVIMGKTVDLWLQTGIHRTWMVSDVISDLRSVVGWGCAGQLRDSGVSRQARTRARPVAICPIYVESISFVLIRQARINQSLSSKGCICSDSYTKLPRWPMGRSICQLVILVNRSTDMPTDRGAK
jgi:hypothetical protein